MGLCSGLVSPNKILTSQCQLREGSFKKTTTTHICPSGPTGGGGSAKIPTSLTDFGADLFNFGLTVYSTNA